ncbi:MAG: sulfotransferase [Maricaulaceae bacterium]|nr:sulfotransferase [Maricaulaceae bacterium]
MREAAFLRAQGRMAEAIDATRRLLARRPDLPDYWFDLGWMLRRAGDAGGALDAYGEALARGAGGPEEIHLNRAAILSDDLRRDAEAEAELQAALRIDPDYVPARLNLGNLHEERGGRDAAAACYQAILPGAAAGADPHRNLRFEALARLAQLHPPQSLTDPVLDRLKTAAAAPGLDETTRANLGFALGRALDALGDYDGAFAAFTAANRAASAGTPPYDAANAGRAAQAIMAAFAAAGPAGAPAAGPQPVFICGMFRSGSTLLERVLAAHPKVTAGGELDFMPRLATGGLAPFPQAMAGVSQQRLAAFAADYRAHLARLFPDAPPDGLITDKRPDNILLAGLIKRLFPAAKIVITVRHPLDNCLSAWFQHINPAVARYAGDLAATGHYYGLTRKLSAHWRALWPDDVTEFDYDAFVREPEPRLRALLAFLGLDWDPACLRFHERGGTVKTASYWQVRRPLYRDASGRWRHYAQHLAPLRAALEQAGAAIPD